MKKFTPAVVYSFPGVVRGGRGDHVEPAVVLLVEAEAVVPLVGPHVDRDAVLGLQEEVERSSPPVSRR